VSVALGSRVRPSTRTASRVLEEQAVVIVIDEQKLHTLNEVGTFLWSAMGREGRPVGELIDAVLEEFDVDRERATEDVLAFLDELAKLGAVEVEDGAGA
jgi:hypothetical protein